MKKHFRNTALLEVVAKNRFESGDSCRLDRSGKVDGWHKMFLAELDFRNTAKRIARCPLGTNTTIPVGSRRRVRRAVAGRVEIPPSAVARSWMHSPEWTAIDGQPVSTVSQ